MTERIYRALLIANWQYPRDPDRLPALHGPRRDLALLRRALTHPVAGLHPTGSVATMPNRTRAAILSRLEEFFGSARPNEQLTVYYSGHGRLNLEDELYLCARDTDTDRLVSSAVAARDLSQMMTSSPARAKVVILDCCYSGSFKSGPTHPRRLAGEGRFVLTSSRRAQLAEDGAGPDQASPFTTFLAEALSGAAPDSDGDGFISIDDVYGHVRARALESAGATPQRSFDQAVGDLVMAHAVHPRATKSTPDPVRRQPARLSTARRRPPSAPAVAEPEPPRPALPPVSLADLTAALAYEKRGDHAAARRLYRPMLGRSGDDRSVFAAQRLARLLAREGDVDGAAAAYRAVIEDRHRERAPQAAVELGDLLATHERTEPALRAYEQAADAGHPRWSAQASFRLAELLAAGGAPDDARSRYRQAMDLGYEPWSSRSALALGESLLRAGRIGEAVAAYQRAALSGQAGSVTTAEAQLRRLRAAGETSLSALTGRLAAVEQIEPDPAPDGRSYRGPSDGLDLRSWRAAETLALVDDPQATSVLRRALQSPVLGARMASALALARRRDGQAAGQLVTLLADPEPEVRWTAVDALTAAGAPAVAALIEALGEPPAIRHLAVQALASMASSATAAIADHLTSERRSVRLGVAEALGRHGSTGVAALLDAVRSPEPEIRATAVDGLLAAGQPAVGALIECLSASDAETRTVAAATLGRIGDRSAVTPLEAVLGDRDEGCRLAAAQALAQLGAAARPALVQGTRHRSEATRTAATRGLIAVGPAAVPDLIRLSEGPDPAARHAYVALAEIGTPAALFQLSAAGRLDLVRPRSAVADDPNP